MTYSKGFLFHEFFLCYYKTTKTATVAVLSFIERGPDQIRTGVEAFAELCLATRPQDLLFWSAIRQLADKDLL
jgi:hypothetical protein